MSTGSYTISFHHYAITGSYIIPTTFASGALSYSSGAYMNSPLPSLLEKGALIYKYSNDDQLDFILNEIESKRLIILDESEDEDNGGWYEVIEPNVMMNNLKKYGL